jgi:hypothetical protein
MALLSATTNIPQRILMGAEAGQLASEQDRANWADYMVTRRKTFAEPYVLKPIVRKLGELGYLDPIAWQNLEFEWPEAFSMNPLEKANSIASIGRSVANLSRRNQFGNPIISDEECRAFMDLPEKPKATDTMPVMPAPVAPNAAQPGQGENPSAITGDTSKVAKNNDGTGTITHEVKVLVEAAPSSTPVRRTFVAARQPDGSVAGEITTVPTLAPVEVPNEAV